MNKEFIFHKACIYFNNGMLVIDAVNISRYNYHRNVVIDIKSNTLTVNCEAVEFGVSIQKGQFNINNITPESTHIYKPLWGKAYTRSNQVVEFLGAKQRTYFSNNWTIII